MKSACDLTNHRTKLSFSDFQTIYFLICRFLNYPSGKGALKPTTVRQIMRKAFKKWSDVTPLTFSEVLSSSDDGADIKIQFARRRHNQEEPPVRYFDGPGGDVAHAFLPNSNWGDLDGDIHFDDEDMFTKDGTEGEDKKKIVRIYRGMGSHDHKIIAHHMYPCSFSHEESFALT